MKKILLAFSALALLATVSGVARAEGETAPKTETAADAKAKPAKTKKKAEGSETKTEKTEAPKK
jgi:hypothetical protein